MPDIPLPGYGRIVSNPEIYCGEPVFAGTRVMVRHIGGLRARGETVERILADFSHLSEADVALAEAFFERFPAPLGKPLEWPPSAS